MRRYKALRKKKACDRSGPPPKKRARPDGPARLHIWKDMDFLNPEVVREREPLYLYPRRGALLPKLLGYPDKKKKSILENKAEVFETRFHVSIGEGPSMTCRLL